MDELQIRRYARSHDLVTIRHPERNHRPHRSPATQRLPGASRLRAVRLQPRRRKIICTKTLGLLRGHGCATIEMLSWIRSGKRFRKIPKNGV